jgi:hypothetical protein
MKSFKDYLNEVSPNIYFPISKKVSPRTFSDNINIGLYDDLRKDGILHPEDMKGLCHDYITQ